MALNPVLNNTLPGTRFHVKDVPTPLTTNTSGDTVLIVGCALDGPCNYPVNAAGIQSLTSFFGPLTYNSQFPANNGGTADTTKTGVYSYNSLLKAYNEAVLGGAQNILLVRVPGTYAVGNASLLGGATVSSIFPGFHYNGSQISAYANSSGTVITIVSQPTTKGQGNIVFSYPANLTFDDVCTQFNNDPRNQTFNVSYPSYFSTGTGANTTVTLATITLAGGTYGTTAPGEQYGGQAGKAALYTSITQTDGTFDNLQGVQADIILFADIYADDDVISTVSGVSQSGTNAQGNTVQSYAYSFLTDASLFCYQQSESNYAMNAILGIRPIQSSQRVTVNHRITRLTTVNYGGYDIDDVTGIANTNLVNIAQFIQTGIPYTDTLQSGNPRIDLGQYVSIVAGPDIWVPSTAIGTYIANPAAHYAGVVSQLAAQNGATNVNVNSNTSTPVSLIYNYTRTDRNILNAGINFNPGVNVGGGAFVTYTARSPESPIITVTSDVTVSSRASDFAQLQICRILQEWERVMRGVCQLFIGAANNTQTITALDSNLQTAADAVANTGALIGRRGSGYDYQILSNTGSGSLGTIAINCWIKPAPEILAIEVYITVEG